MTLKFFRALKKKVNSLSRQGYTMQEIADDAGVTREYMYRLISTTPDIKMETAYGIDRGLKMGFFKNCG